MGSTIDRTLIVGASGRVGRMLSAAWRAAGQAPVLQYRGAALPVDLPQIAWSPLESNTDLSGIKAMIVLAGAVPGRGNLSLNAQLADACLRAADKVGIGRVLLASSSAVYGTNDGRPCTETTPTQPVNEYGRAKLEAEAVAERWRQRGLSVCCLRIGNVAGADALLLNVAKGQPVQVDQFADGGGPIRSYIGPQTLARLLAALLEHDLPPTLNLATPAPVAMADLAQAAGADWRYAPAPATAHQRITLDCSALAKLYRFEANDSDAAAMVAEWRATQA